MPFEILIVTLVEATVFPVVLEIPRLHESEIGKVLWYLYLADMLRGASYYTYK